MKHWTILAATLTGALALGIAGCESEGPAEEAGEDVDEAVEETRQELDKLQEKAEEQVEAAEEELESGQ